MVVWDFSTALEMTVASPDNQTVRLQKIRRQKTELRFEGYGDNSVGDVRRSDFRKSDWQCGLQRMFPFTAGCMVAWDFSTALEMTVVAPDNQTVRLKRVLSKFFLLIMWKIVQIEFIRPVDHIGVIL